MAGDDIPLRERLVRIEVGQDSIKQSIKALQSSMDEHMKEERLQAKRIDDIESDFDKLRGGAKVFLFMSSGMTLLIAGIWAVYTWFHKGGPNA